MILLEILPFVAPALRYADNPRRIYWRLDLLLYTLVVWLLDMLVAHIWFAPQKNEWTVSHVLERTAHLYSNDMALARAINAISPGHIKTV